MKNNKIIYLLILIGGAVAIYAQATEDQDEFFLILGIIILMFGVFQISRNIPSKIDTQNQIEEEEE